MRLAAIVLAVAVAACGRLPPAHVPQAEQASQAVHRGGERFRAHQRCAATTRTVEDFVHCMDTEGYLFVPRAPDEPAAAQCWESRAAAEEGTFPPPHCFVHAPDAPH